MSIVLAALLAAGQMPDLERAIVNYAALAAETDRGGDPEWSVLAATNVCRIALRYTVATGEQSATDLIIGYQGPRADRLKLACSVYFQARAR